MEQAMTLGLDARNQPYVIYLREHDNHLRQWRQWKHWQVTTPEGWTYATMQEAHVRDWLHEMDPEKDWI